MSSVERFEPDLDNLFSLNIFMIFLSFSLFAFLGRGWGELINHTLSHIASYFNIKEINGTNQDGQYEDRNILTGSRGLLFAQVMTVEMRINILGFSILSRSECNSETVIKY